MISLSTALHVLAGIVAGWFGRKALLAKIGARWPAIAAKL